MGSPRPILNGVELNEGSLGERSLINPATQEAIASLAVCGRSEAVYAAKLASLGFEEWSAVSAIDRSVVLRRAADQMRAEQDVAAREITTEQGKPIAQAKGEWLASADLLDWYAEEGRRTYGRLIPSRSRAMSWAVHRRPVGPVAAFAPWNFPAWTPMQKIAPALAAGCSIVLKAAEETPSAAWRICRALLAAGLPPKAIGLLWGDPAEISASLIAAPEMRKVTLTGSARVGRILSRHAGEMLKPTTMELGGHNAVIVARDAKLDELIPMATEFKFRNAGQVCVSPTRFLVEATLYGDFVAGVREAAKNLVVGNGLDPATQMGPLTTSAQLEKVEALSSDGIKQGAKLECGGGRIGNRGFYFEPTVLSGVHAGMRAMNEEPFGPLMLISPFDDIEDAIAEANRLPFGLASYAFTSSSATERRLTERIQAGMLGINHFSLAMPETPFGGIGDSGWGSEGGSEGIDAFTRPFLVSARAS